MALNFDPQMLRMLGMGGPPAGPVQPTDPTPGFRAPPPAMVPAMGMGMSAPESGGAPGMGSGLGGLSSMLGGGGGMGGGGLGGMLGGGGGSGGGMSPWDMLFAGLGRAHGAIDGNDPNAPMVPHERRPHGSDSALIGVGAPIGGAIGSMFGFGQSGTLAGQNAGATISDLFNGDIHNLGLDVSQNLPPIPGMKRSGWKGLLNGATGLPVASLFDLFK